MIRLLAVTFLVLSAQVGAQSLHVFKDGETIDAARFNDNFTALKDAINSGGSPQDGVAYGSPVWVDSNGTVLTGRDSTRVLWRVDGELKVIGVVEDGVYTGYVQRFYSTQNCTGDEIGLQSQSGYFWVSNGFINTQGALLENSPLPYNSTNFTLGSNCYAETGTIDMYQESSIGVAAPSWTMDGTQMLPDLR